MSAKWEVVNINNYQNKPKRTSRELVKMLYEEKGIRFELMSKDDAVEYLEHTNNYLRTASYRKNYPKHTMGVNAGKYINLDFAYLAELSTLDFYLREYLLKMCIDIEHALKVALLAEIEQDPNENGYDIVCHFLRTNKQVLCSIEQKADAIFTGELISKYFDLCYAEKQGRSNTYDLRIVGIDCPVWVLVEIISFGDLVKLCEFYSRNSDRHIVSFSINRNIINPIKSLRNACAHNNCLLTSLKPSATTRPSHTISSMVASIPSISKAERQKKLSSRPIFEILCLLYEYQILVSSKVRNNRMAQLKGYVDGRMFKHIAYFSGPTGNQTVESTLTFLRKVVDNCN